MKGSFDASAALSNRRLRNPRKNGIGLAFFLVVAIKSNLSTNDAAKVQNKTERGIAAFSFILTFDDSNYLITIFCVITLSPLMRRRTYIPGVIPLVETRFIASPW